MKKKVLITGASGFVGSYFVNNYSDKYEFVRFSFLSDDIDTLVLDGIDTIVYLSALVHQMSGDVEYQEYIRVNVDNTIKLAQKAKNCGIGHFVYMSTVKVYGEENDIPYSENTTPNPIDNYGKSKLIAEEKLQGLSDDSFVVSMLRTPIVYGAGVKGNIANLCNMIDKVSILPLGGINNKRSMVYIGNLCDMMSAIIDTKSSGVFLAGDDEPISTTHFINLIAKAKNKNIYLVSLGFLSIFIKLLKPNFYKRLYGNLAINNTLSKQKLSFVNKISVEDGIKQMVGSKQ